MEQLVSRILSGERNIKYLNPMLRLFGEHPERCKNCKHLTRRQGSKFGCSWWLQYAPTPNRVFRKKFTACNLFKGKGTENEQQS